MKVDASIWTSEQIERHAATSERVVAFGLMFLSFAGTYLGATGGVLVLRPDVVFWSVLWQLVMSVFQFIHVKNWNTPWYLVPLLLSVLPTAFGYGTLLVPYIVPMLESFGIWYPSFLAYVIILVASFGIDIIPERILVRGRR